MSNANEGEARTFTVKREMIELSVTMKNLLVEMPDNDDESEPTLIPLPNITGSMLEKILAYATHYHENPDPEVEAQTEAERRAAEISGWDQAFILELTLEQLFQLTLAANYLDMKPLLDLGCKQVANLIRGKKPEEIKLLFGVTREFSPEEEEQVKRENPWMVEGN